jgi:hypothetical protein
MGEEVMSSAADAPHQAERETAVSSFSWDALLKWSAFLITIGGLALHVAGSRYHEARIAAWGLEADLFPKPVEWVLMTGYYVIVGAFAEAYLYLKTYWWKLVIWGLCVASVCFALLMLALHNKEDALKRFLRTWLKRLPRWLLALGFTTFYVSVVCVFILLAPLLLVGVLYLPAQFGKEAGDKVANSQITQYSKGCEAGAPKLRCIVFRRDGQPELKGFLIESSDSQLAIYLPGQKQVQVLKRDGVELVVTREPVSGSENKVK